MRTAGRLLALCFLIVGCHALDPDTRLIDAAIEGDTTRVWLAIKSGASVNAQVKGTSALIGACLRPDLHLESSRRIVRLLLDAGADVDVRDSYGATALTRCAASGDIHLVRMLTDAGAAVNARTNNGTTPLMSAVTSGELAVVRHLVALGADPWARTDEGETAHSLAVAGRHDDIAAFLAQINRGASEGPRRGNGGGQQGLN